MAPEPRYLKLVIFEKMIDNCFGFALSQKNRIRKAYLLSWYLLHVSIQDFQVSTQYNLGIFIWFVKGVHF